ncbi:MAG: DNA translocase FtsK 4TM domain-containing protein [Pseudomonadota bacterium]
MMPLWLPPVVMGWLVRAATVVLGAGLVIVAVALTACLVTYDSGDPSFMVTTDRTEVVNWGGIIGSHLADILFVVFGQAVFFLPPLVAVWGVLLCAGRSFYGFGYRLIPLPFALLFICGGFAMRGDNIQQGNQMGGQVGYLVRHLSDRWLSAYDWWTQTSLWGGVFILLGFGFWLMTSNLRRADIKLGARAGRYIVERLHHPAPPLRPQKIQWGKASPVTSPVPPTPAAPVATGGGKGGGFSKLSAAQAKAGSSSSISPASPVVSDISSKAEGSSLAALKQKLRERKQAREEKRQEKNKEKLEEKRAQKREQKKNPPPMTLMHDTQEGEDLMPLPPMTLLPAPPRRIAPRSAKELAKIGQQLQNVLSDFSVSGEIVDSTSGPVVTVFEFDPAPGVKISRIVGLADDVARSMSALSTRIATVRGRSVLGIELPNPQRQMVSLREVLEDVPAEQDGLILALGKDIAGAPVYADLARMPHLLIAGTTGSGKSIAINAMIMSLLFRHRPDQLRLILIDPKMLELSVYDHIPHLLTPVVTSPKKAVVALKWTVAEMESRYKKMAQLGVRNIDSYNRQIKNTSDPVITRRVQTGFDPETGAPVFESQMIDANPLPYIVVVVDEMADLMMVAGKDVEIAIQRLAQMARAAGIHIIMATQRPSVDVVTGTIKANFPHRISFQVASKIDSRTILGEGGAEQLLGRGDMLYLAGGQHVTRVHGAFIDDADVLRVIRHLKQQGDPDYINDVTEEPEEAMLGESEGGQDELYTQAVEVVLDAGRASTSYLQRRLQIGYNRAANLMEMMEARGVVSPAGATGKREILQPR